MPSDNFPGLRNRHLPSIAITVVFALTSLSISAPTFPGQAGWASGFDGGKALQHVKVLASDSLRGRYSGFDGSDKANRYIAEHFDELELEPPWGRDGYMHRFNYGAGEYVMPSSLIAHFPDGSTDTANFWKDLNVFKYSGFGKAKASVVFVGYGISSPENGWDDYAGVDVKGAIVLAWRGTPHLEGKDFGVWGMSGRKSSFALEKGAVGFVYCETDPPKYATISEEFYREKLPAMWVSKSFADSLLKGTAKTKDQWKQLVDSTKSPVSRMLDVQIEMQVSGKYYPKRKTQNIAGLLLGSDPILRNEVVLIGAHMDHHGVDPAGNLYPGADDNASGTATMMELARVFSQKQERPKRSIMFMGFAAEEEGLNGSKSFVKEMRLPKGMNIVAMLNMDMVGQGNCSLGVGGISEFPVLAETMFKDWPDSALKQLDFWGLYDGSDHASFRDAGISSYVIGARGDHPNYHTPGDSAGNINPNVMKSVGDMMFNCVENLANAPEMLKPWSGRGQWLVNLYGGVKFETASIGQYGTVSFDSLLQWPVSAPQIKGVDYQFPITILTIERKPGIGGKQGQPHSMMEEWIDRLPFEWILNALENLNLANDLGTYPLIKCDSLPAMDPENIEGAIAATINLSRIPVEGYSLTTLNALRRLGVGFDAMAIGPNFAAPLRGIERGPNKESLVSVLKLSAAFIRRANLRPIFTFESDSLIGNSRYITAIAENAGFWSKQVVCRIDISTTKYEDINELIESGVFVYLESFDKLKEDQKDQSLQYLQGLLKQNRPNVGIEPVPEVIQNLLVLGVSESEIGKLLVGNFQWTLKAWWADKNYSDSHEIQLIGKNETK